MLKRLIIKLLFSFHKDITKISDEKELSSFLFNNPTNSEEMLKARITSQLARYWDNPSEINKAIGIVYKVLLDNHRLAKKIINTEKNPARQAQIWKKNKLF